MLYSFIPPFLVIISLIIIIIFIVKKASRLESFQDSMLEKMSEDEAINGITAEEIMKSKSSKRGEKIKNGLLGLLEIITKIFRLIFLKLDTCFKNWSEKIRKKREKKTAYTFREEKIMEPSSQEGTRIKLNEDGESDTGAEQESKKPENIRQPRVFRVHKPMISEKVVIPTKKTEIKDRLEDILIERIAINSKDIEAYERLGEYYMDIGNNDYAKECFKQVIKLNPANRSAKFKLKKIEKLLSF